MTAKEYWNLYRCDEAKRAKVARSNYRSEVFSCFCSIMKNLITKEVDWFDSIIAVISIGREYDDERYVPSFWSANVDFIDGTDPDKDNADLYKYRDAREIIRDAADSANHAIENAFLEQALFNVKIEIKNGVISIKDSNGYWEYKEE